MRGTLLVLALVVALPLPGPAGQITVQPGETLSQIAERHGISLRQLMQLNGLTSANLVQAGSTLRLPGGGSARGGGAGSVIVQKGQTLSEIAEQYGLRVATLMRLNGLGDADQLQVGQRLFLGGAAAPPGAARASAGRAGGAVHVVRPGETLSEIASSYGLPVEKLAALNAIADPDRLDHGTTLRLGIAAKTTAAATGGSTRGGAVHVVRPGETLSEIASSYGLPMEKLAALNAIADPDYVEPGARLKLRGAAPTPPPARAPRPARSAQAAPAGSRPAGRSSGNVRNQSGPSAGAAATATATTTSGSGTSAASDTPAASGSAATASTTAAAAGKPATLATPAVGPTGLSGTTPTPRLSGDPAAPRAATAATAVALASRTTAVNPADRPPAGGNSASKGMGSPTVSGARAVAPRPDWRTYGPLQVNWTAWQSMGGSMVAPSLNARGQTLYVAINCGARKINATTISGQWQTWNDPGADFEQQLVGDFCRGRS